MRGMKLAFALALSLLAGTGAALAHGAAKPAHGGQLAETADGTRVEFIQRQGGIGVWVRDHDDKPIPPTKVSGKATLLVGGKKLELALKIEGDALVADGPISPADKVTVILNLTVDGKPEATRFSSP